MEDALRAVRTWPIDLGLRIVGISLAYEHVSSMRLLGSAQADGMSVATLGATMP